MTLDEFQARFRAICDALVERAVESKRRHDAALDLLFADAEEADEPSAEALGPVVNAEMVRLAERLRTAGAED
jgi:hypothetical protein